MNPRNFFAELKRRNVYKVAVALLLASSLLLSNKVCAVRRLGWN